MVRLRIIQEFPVYPEASVVATRKLFVILTARYDSRASRFSVLWRK
jgi:hypothetical protein